MNGQINPINIKCVYVAHWKDSRTEAIANWFGDENVFLGKAKLQIADFQLVKITPSAVFMHSWNGEVPANNFESPNNKITRQYDRFKFKLYVLINFHIFSFFYHSRSEVFWMDENILT